MLECEATSPVECSSRVLLEGAVVGMESLVDLSESQVAPPATHSGQSFGEWGPCEPVPFFKFHMGKNAHAHKNNNANTNMNTQVNESVNMSMHLYINCADMNTDTNTSTSTSMNMT